MPKIYQKKSSAQKVLLHLRKRNLTGFSIKKVRNGYVLARKMPQAISKHWHKRSSRGLEQDRRIKAKRIRKKGEPYWAGDLKGSKV